MVAPFVLSDGRLAVPDAGSRDIRVFGADGELQERLGGRGEGPGEFVDLSAAWPRGDTIEAYDARLRRVTRFVPGGAAEVVPIGSGAHADVGLGVGPLGRGWALGGVADAGNGRRDRIAVHRFDRDGGHIGEMFSVSGIVRYWVDGVGGGPAPLSPRAVVRSDGNAVYFGDTLEPMIRRADGQDVRPDPGGGRTPTADPATATASAPGVAENEIAWEPARSPGEGSRLPVRDALGRVIDLAVSQAPPDEASVTRARLEAAPVPDGLSAFWDFLVDPEGFVWIQPYDPIAHAFALGARYLGGVGSGGAWLVIGLDGRSAGTIEVPEGLELTQITRASVVGIRRDELGVESVHVHPLRRRR